MHIYSGLFLAKKLLSPAPHNVVFIYTLVCSSNHRPLSGCFVYWVFKRDGKWLYWVLSLWILYIM